MAAAARAAATSSLLRSAATSKIASGAPPPLHPSRHYLSRAGGYTQPPTAAPASGSSSHHPSLYSRPTPPTQKKKKTITVTGRISEFMLEGINAQMRWLECDATCGAAYLVMAGGFLFLSWAKRKDERDAAARQKADDERVDAMLRDAYDEMVRVVGHE